MSERAGWIYTARERFSPAYGKGWDRYVEFSGFSHVTEVVTLDTLLCPELVNELVDEDWEHNVQADFRITWFEDFDYLIRRVEWRPGRDQILAIREKPSESYDPPAGFEVCGFDILDEDISNSVLTNCGKFPEIFDSSEVNAFGLIADLNRANSIAQRIREHGPLDHHCRACRVWQIARRKF